MRKKKVSASLTIWMIITLLLSNAAPVYALGDRGSHESIPSMQNGGAQYVVPNGNVSLPVEGTSTSLNPIQNENSSSAAAETSRQVMTGNRYQSQVNQPEIPTDQIIVKYKSGTNAFLTPQQTSQMERASNAAGKNLQYARAMSGNSHVLKLPEHLPLVQVQAMTERLMRLPEVEYAEPDLILTPTITPNDPQYPNQWHYFGTYGINAPAAWDMTTGSSSIVMAVIDTGITNHADLSGRILPGYDFINDVLVANDGNGRDNDARDPGNWISAAENSSGYFEGCPVQNSNWHGTHVAGTMGAASNNGIGVAGVNWNSMILPVRVLGKCGGYVSDITDGMRWAAGLPVTGVPNNPNPAKVLNISLGGYGTCDTTTQNAINSITSVGSVVVVAAGNSADNAGDYSPGNCNGVITVAATAADGWRATYSNYGSVVEISAPGGNWPYDTGILSTVNTGTTVPVADTYAYYNGTSMSAPHVSGVISLMFSLNPNLTPSQVLQILQNTAKPFLSTGGCNTSICGAGIVDAGSAVNAVPAGITSFSPTSGPAGTSVTISGFNFSRVSSVRFNGISASFSIVSPTSINAIVPVGATTGPITITNPGGTATSASNFRLPVVSGIYDDSTSAWGYSGSWSTYNGSGPYSNTLHQNNTTGNFAEVTFNGVQVMLTYLKAPGRGSIAVFIDNVQAATLNAYSSSIVWQATWTSSLLTPGIHTVRFQNAGGGWIDLDALQVVAPDSAAPAAITTLAATTGIGNGAVNLSWTAVGDDNTTGTATSYLVRYASSPILTNTDWNNATVVSSGIPTPKAAGQAETMTITGLTAGQTYYFAVRAQDEQANLGALSNSPSATASSSPAVGAGIYDDSDPAWSYTGSWNVYNGSGPYSNTLHQSNTTGNFAEVTFNGTQVTLTYLKAPGRGSIAVYIDNFVTPVTTLNAYSASIVWQATWTSSLLTHGIHTVRFQNAGGGWIDLDALQVVAPDSTAPAAITTLAATTGIGNGAVNLNWTAVGDDNTTGTATSYLVRYAASPISTNTAWNNATPVTSGIPTPKAAGQAETMMVTGLTAGQTYYFAVRAQDEQANLGALSNSPSAAAGSSPAVGAGIYDDMDSAWSYTGSWNVYNGSGPYSNTLHQNNTTGNTAEVTFNGTQVTLTYLKAPGRGSIAVYIDNFVTPVTTLNAYSASIVWQATWTSASLTPGVHTVRFQNAGGGWVDLDALQVVAPDSTAPAAITTLAATTGAGNGAVNLNWTAVGDDNTTGTATSYLVRYAASPISTNTAWNNATVVSSGIPTPKAAGQAETMTVTGLTAGQTYYFAVRAQDEQANLGALSNSPSAAASSTPFVDPGTYDDSDPAWSYSGTWTTFSGSGPYNNTLHQSSTTENAAAMTFNGNQIKLTYLKAPGRGSIAVYIDNVQVATLNAYSASIVWQATWTSAVLSNGVHTVRFQNAGGGWIDIDAIQIFASATSGTYDDSDPALNYSGTWTTFSGSGPYNNSLHQSNTTGSYSAMTFTGNQVKLTYLKAPGRGSIAVYIDNVQVATLNANSASIVWQATWTSANLTPGVHTVRIQNAGGGWIDLDAITVLP